MVIEKTSQCFHVIVALKVTEIDENYVNNDWKIRVRKGA